MLEPTAGELSKHFMPKWVIPNQSHSLEVKKIQEKEEKNLGHILQVCDKEERAQRQGEVGVCWVPPGQGPLPPHSVPGPCRAGGRGSGTTILPPLCSPVQEQAVLIQPLSGHGWEWACEPVRACQDPS